MTTVGVPLFFVAVQLLGALITNAVRSLEVCSLWKVHLRSRGIHCDVFRTASGTR